MAWSDEICCLTNKAENEQVKNKNLWLLLRKQERDSDWISTWIEMSTLDGVFREIPSENVTFKLKPEANSHEKKIIGMII